MELPATHAAAYRCIFSVSDSAPIKAPLAGANKTGGKKEGEHPSKRWDALLYFGGSEQAYRSVSLLTAVRRRRKPCGAALDSVPLLRNIGRVQQFVGLVAAGLAEIGFVQLLDHGVLVRLPVRALFILPVQGFGPQGLEVHMSADVCRLVGPAS